MILYKNKEFCKHFQCRYAVMNDDRLCKRCMAYRFYDYLLDRGYLMIRAEGQDHKRLLKKIEDRSVNDEISRMALLPEDASTKIEFYSAIEFYRAINELFYLFNQNSKFGGLVLKDGADMIEVLRKTNAVIVTIMEYYNDQRTT
jgi:hypothetical protein